MKKFKEKIIKKVKEEIEYAVSNCIKCNNSVITDSDYPDLKHKPVALFNKMTHASSGGIINIYGGKCHKCGATYEESDKNKGEYKYEAALVWNINNNIDMLIARQEANIAGAKLEIERLKQIKEVRNKVKDLN